MEDKHLFHFRTYRPAFFEGFEEADDDFSFSTIEDFKKGKTPNRWLAQGDVLKSEPYTQDYLIVTRIDDPKLVMGFISKLDLTADLSTLLFKKLSS